MSQNSKHDLGQVLGQILGREKCLLNCPPVFGTYGVRIGPKLLFNLGGLTQGVVGILPDAARRVVDVIQTINANAEVA